jgi:predicted  nucleic acid-binding Zn-ribbon protein
MERLHCKPAGVVPFFFFLLAFGYVGLAGSGGVVQGYQDLGHQDHDKDVAKTLLTELWPRSLENREASATLYQEHITAVSESPIVSSAYAWNRMQHSRYREARVVFQSLVDREEPEVGHLIGLSWVQFVLNDTDLGLMTLQKIKAQLTKLPADDPQRNAALLHMGRMVGYAQGPLNTRVNKDILKSTDEVALADLNQHDSAIYTDGLREIIEQFEDMSADQTKAKEEFLVTAKEKAQNEIQLIEAENNNIAQRTAQLVPEAQQLTETFNNEASALRAQAQPLQANQAALQSQITSLSFDLQQVYGEIALQQSFLNDNEESRRNFFVRNRLNQLYFLARDIESQIVSANFQLRNINGQLHGLLQQQNQLANQHDHMLGQLNQERRNLQRQLTKNRSRIVKLSDEPKRLGGEAQKLAQQLDQFSTFYRLPLEQIRQFEIERLK